MYVFFFMFPYGSFLRCTDNQIVVVFIAISDEFQKEMRSNKREGLIPFPRIGRRSESKNSKSLWFGPRLGRSTVMVPDNYETSYLDAGNNIKVSNFESLMQWRTQNFFRGGVIEYVNLMNFFSFFPLL